MPVRVLLVAGWVIFAFLVGCCGYLALAACDLGVRPLFGLGYCTVHAAPDRLGDQRARERDLRDHIHEAELRLARLPVCAAPTPSPPEPKKEARVVTPTPTPTPTPKPTPIPEPSPTETPQPQEQLKIPKNLSELQGCWQSVRGDIHIVTDDAEEKPMGDIRLCYCFGNSGRGSVQAFYTDGVRCRGPLQARIYSDRLVMKHQGLKCTASGHDINPGEIECKGTTEGETAACDWTTHGTHSGDNDAYQRVPPERCR
jgi:hypothetical protein